MQPHLANIINSLSQSNILNKSALFLKPGDFMDDAEALSADLQDSMGRDVILKRMFSKGHVPHAMCPRCGGKSEVGGEFTTGHISPRWRAWEKMWKARCICGSNWMKPDIR